MGTIAAALRHMLAANMPAESIVQAVSDMEVELHVDEQAERRRAADRERHRLNRLRKSAESADKNDVPRASVTRVDDKTLTSEIEPQKEEKKETRVPAQWAREFDEEFWPRYPHKVGKADAKSKFFTARRAAPLETILNGLGRYVAKTDDRPWCNPATWLHQERWTDEPAAPVARAGPEPPRINPTLAAARRLQEQIDAASPSEIEGNHPPALVLAFSGR